MKTNPSFETGRRQVLRMLGLGATGTAIAVIAASSRVFAKQFAGEVAEIKVPKMVYDPKLQMMVDPETRDPIYVDPRKVATSSATVTAGCPTCPKCDDNCTD
jgi:hypothetical protein